MNINIEFGNKKNNKKETIEMLKKERMDLKVIISGLLKMTSGIGIGVIVKGLTRNIKTGNMITDMIITLGSIGIAGVVMKETDEYYDELVDEIFAIKDILVGKKYEEVEDENEDEMRKVIEELEKLVKDRKETQKLIEEILKNK